MSPERSRLSEKSARLHLEKEIEEQSLREELDAAFEQVKASEQKVKEQLRVNKKDKFVKQEARAIKEDINKEKKRLRKINTVVKRLEKGKPIKPKNAVVYNPQQVLEGKPVKKDLFGKLAQGIFGERPTPGIVKAKQELHEIEKDLKKRGIKKKDSTEYQEAKQHLAALQTVPRYSPRTLDEEFITETVKRVKEGIYFDPPKGTLKKAQVIELKTTKEGAADNRSLKEKRIAEYFSTRDLLDEKKAAEIMNEKLEAYLNEECPFEEFEGAIMDYWRAYYTRKGEPEAYLKMKASTERTLDQVQKSLDEDEEEIRAQDAVIETERKEIREEMERRGERARALYEEDKKKRRNKFFSRMRRILLAVGGLALVTASEVRNHKAEQMSEQPVASETQREEPVPETVPEPDVPIPGDEEGGYIPDDQIWEGREGERPTPTPFSDLVDSQPGTIEEEEESNGGVSLTPEQLLNTVDSSTLTPEQRELRNRILGGEPLS